MVKQKVALHNLASAISDSFRLITIQTMAAADQSQQSVFVPETQLSAADTLPYPDALRLIPVPDTQPDTQPSDPVFKMNTQKRKRDMPACQCCGKESVPAYTSEALSDNEDDAFYCSAQCIQTHEQLEEGEVRQHKKTRLGTACKSCKDMRAENARLKKELEDTTWELDEHLQKEEAGNTEESPLAYMKVEIARLKHQLQSAKQEAKQMEAEMQSVKHELNAANEKLRQPCDV